MSDDYLNEFANIVTEIESTPFNSLPNVDEVVRRIVGELIGDDDIALIAEFLGRVDFDEVKAEIYQDIIATLAATPGFWDTVQFYVRTIIIWERYLNLR